IVLHLIGGWDDQVQAGPYRLEHTIPPVPSKSSPDRRPGFAIVLAETAPVHQNSGHGSRRKALLPKAIPAGPDRCIVEVSSCRFWSSAARAVAHSGLRTPRPARRSSVRSARRSCPCPAPPPWTNPKRKRCLSARRRQGGLPIVSGRRGTAAR